LHALTLKYFKQVELIDPIPTTADSQDMIKNLLNTFFPKNKQINKKVFHSTTKLNGVWLCNKPPRKSIQSSKINDPSELIPIEIKVFYEDIAFEEVILWDSLKKDVPEILSFSYLYLQDLMKENEKFDIERTTLESISIINYLIKNIFFNYSLLFDYYCLFLHHI